jgi:zinc/manganese transport system substrate-binding protein
VAEEEQLRGILSGGYRKLFQLRRSASEFLTIEDGSHYLHVPMHRRTSTALSAILLACASACTIGGARGSGAADGDLQVAAAENFWGSIAAQLGGDRVEVRSIVSNPNADPHDYEPTAEDARAFASADIVIENGIGYDPWAQKLLDANPVEGRTVIDVGDVVGVEAGGNPHQWYSPDSVRSVINAIAIAYDKQDPASRSYFAKQKTSLENVTLQRYFSLIAQIRTRYADTPVGASESIFAPMASALGLRLITPASFLDAVSEGSEPTAADLTTIHRQISGHQIAVYVYNSQNAIPDIQRQIDECRAAGIPVTTVTETLVPVSATFQAWQTSELEGLEAALRKAVGH